MTWLALDIGGANLKLADGLGTVAATPFALWKAPQRLAEELKKFVAGSGVKAERIAVTMTGELVDCFASKTEGVRHILAAVNDAFPTADRRIYLVDGRFARPEVAAENILLTAASNWHALASFAARYVPTGKRGLLIDVGSTTTDIIPLIGGKPVTEGTTDTTRMLAGELCYNGVERTPCCGLRERVYFRDSEVTLAKEFFATMKDAYMMLDFLPENPNDRDTADGRPATKPNAVRRLGKMVCADELEFSAHDAVEIAKQLAAEQIESLSSSISVVHESGMDSNVHLVILSGHGDFLAQAAMKEAPLRKKTISLTEELGPIVSRCATAHALAVLAREAMP